MSDHPVRVRLHDVQVTGDRSVRAAVLEAIERAVGAAISGGRSSDPKALRNRVEEAVTQQVVSPPDRVSRE